MFGKLNNEEIEALLREQIIGRIGCHAGGVTYVVPIGYVFDDNCVYAHTIEGMKMDIMRRNPNLCFQVDNTKNLANWRSVICWGEFQELKTEPERREALQKLNARALPIISSETMHLTPQWPFSTDRSEEVEGVFFRIRITEKTGRFERSADDFFFAT